MLTTLRILRGIVGFIAIWQVIGLLPIFTNWLPNLSSTTGNMWAIAILKLLVLAISGAAYYWLAASKRDMRTQMRGQVSYRLLELRSVRS